MTTEEEAKRLSYEMIEHNIRFSVNPVTLEDMFYYMVARVGGQEGGRRVTDERAHQEPAARVHTCQCHI